MSRPKIAIIGGGITGLACAWYLTHSDLPCELFLIDVGEEFGGTLKTDHIGGYLIERSADMFSAEPADAIELIRKLGKENELVGTQPVVDRAYVAVPMSKRYPNGLAPVPRGFSLMLPTDPQAVIESEILDSAGTQRFLAERQVPKKTDDKDESLQSFAVRRFGQQVFERLIQPLVSGIYTADPEKLSMQATMARFSAMEQEHGSLLAAAEFQQNSAGQATVRQVEPNRKGGRPSRTRQNVYHSGDVFKGSDPFSDRLLVPDQTASGARYDLFRSPRLGMSQLVDWITNELGSRHQYLKTRVSHLQKTERGWKVGLQSAQHPNERSESLECDAVIITASPSNAAKLVSGISYAGSTSVRLADKLRSIPAASCAIVAIGLEQSQLSVPFNGFGIVVPSYLQRKLIAASFASNKFPGRAPEGRVLIRGFIGGAANPEAVELPDDELLALTLNELNQWFQIKGQPELTRVYRWINAMPQYHLGHQQRVLEIRELAKSFNGLCLAGNSYNGVGLPVCIQGGALAAKKVTEFLRHTNQ